MTDDEHALTESVVDQLSAVEEPQTAMEVALALRRPYPAIETELAALERLGIVVRVDTTSATRWRLG